MQQGIADLLFDLLFVRADCLDVLLVQEDVIRRVGGKDALQSPRNAREKPQQQSAPIRFPGRRILYNYGKVRQPAAEWLRQIVQDLAHQSFETLTFHGTIVHAGEFRECPS